MKRLKQEYLAGLPDDIRQSSAARCVSSAGIVHLGVGAFHRAHQAVYTQHANICGSDAQWHIIGASLRSAGVRDQLAPQDFYYTVVSRDDNGEQRELIGVLRDVIVATENPAALIEAMAADSTRILSLTVTEKGYCHLPDTGRLNPEHPDILHDLQHPDRPRSAIGFIVAALSRRQLSGAAGVTILSCDNLPDNGVLCKTVITELARRQDPLLSSWIERCVSFPSTMVDRIVPATSDADRLLLAQHIGMEDQGMVVCEPFCQWVIEDDFVAGRPAWEKAGALLVDDVTPFEQMKLRLLNGSHSSMAYLGVLCGLDYMHQVIADPSLHAFVTHLMDEEMSPTLDVPTDFDLGAYKSELRQRFANSALQHRTAQVAMDGTQKLPQRLLQPLRRQLDTGGSIQAISLAVAAWMRYVSTAETVDDPLADEIAKRCAGHHDDAGAIALALLQMDSVFGSDLPGNRYFVDSVCYWLDKLHRQSARATIDDFLTSST